jgi:hypothetical protein
MMLFPILSEKQTDGFPLFLPEQGYRKIFSASLAFINTFCLERKDGPATFARVCRSALLLN